MEKNRTVTTDEILVEFEGCLSDTVVKLGRIVRGYHRTYPDEDNLWWESSEAVQEYLSLISQMNQLAPEGYSFRGHIQQPQCLGFWPDETE